MAEIWKKHPELVDYVEFSNMGGARFTDREFKINGVKKIREGCPITRNTSITKLPRATLRTKDKKVINVSIAALIAECFIQGFDRRTHDVDVKDGNPNNLAVDNLEVVHNGEKTKRILGRKVKCLDKKTGKIKEYEYASEAVNDGLNADMVRRACRGEVEQYKGRIFWYADEPQPVKVAS